MQKRNNGKALTKSSDGFSPNNKRALVEQSVDAALATVPADTPVVVHVHVHDNRQVNDNRVFILQSSFNSDGKNRRGELHVSDEFDQMSGWAGVGPDW